MVTPRECTAAGVRADHMRGAPHGANLQECIEGR